MPNRKNPLQKQLDHQKFLHAISYVRNESGGLKHLSTTELARINLFISGHSQNSEQAPTTDVDGAPWRTHAVTIQIPGGTHPHQMNVITNPIARARDLIGLALQMNGNGEGLKAATYLYSNLVLEHLFTQANRRTAVAAALWILLLSGYDCDAELLLALPVGNLRKSADLAALEAKIQGLVSKA